MSGGDGKKPGEGAGDKPADPLPDPLPDPLNERRARQARALRANLRRRKDQARRRADAGAAPRKPPGGE